MPRDPLEKLRAKAFAVLLDDFAQNGQAVVATLRKKKPDVYLKLIVDLIKTIRLEVGRPTDFSAARTQDELFTLVEDRAGPEARQALQGFVGRYIVAPEEQAEAVDSENLAH